MLLFLSIFYSLDPNNYFALNNLALIYDRHHRRGEAETLLRNAVNVKPQFSVGWMNLGVVQMGRKKYDVSAFRLKLDQEGPLGSGE